MKRTITDLLKTFQVRSGRKILNILLIVTIVASILTGAVSEVVETVHAEQTFTVTYSTATDGDKIYKDGVVCTKDYDPVNKCFLSGYFRSLDGCFTKIVVDAAYLENIGTSYGWKLDGTDHAVWEGTVTDYVQEVRFGAINGTSNIPVVIEFTVYIPDEYSVNISGGEHATHSGDLTQTVPVPVSRSIDSVVFTADSGFHFNEFDPIIKNGITVERTKDTEVTVSGTPTNSVSVVVPYAVFIPVTGVSLSPTSQEVSKNKVFKIEATVFPKEAPFKSLIWTVDKNVKLYSDEDCTNEINLGEMTGYNTVYGKTAESIQVTVKSAAYESKSATCSVIVKDAPTPTVTHTVTFDPNNGDDIFTVGVEDGKKITSIPSTDNYKNEKWKIHHKEYNNGWHKSPFKPGDGTFDFSNTPIDSSITLFLVWESDFSVAVNDQNMGKVGYARKGIDPVAEFSSGAFTILKDYDDVYNFTAEALPGYRFVKWVDESGETVSTDRTITNYKCNAKGKLTAVFEERFFYIAVGITDNGTVDIDYEHPKTIEGPDAINFSTGLDFAVLRATPADGSSFLGWYEGTVNKTTGFVDGNTGVLVSGDPVISIGRNSKYKAVQAVFGEDEFYCPTGEDQSYIIGSGNGLTFVFRRSVAAEDKNTYDLFDGIKMDGNTVERIDRNYTAEKGSVVIRLQPAYLDTLAEGKHILTAEFKNEMTADVSFTIVKKSGGGGDSDKDSDKDSSSVKPAYKLPITGIDW